MIRASIDIGSNSVLLLAGSVTADGDFDEILNESNVTSLGKGLSRTGEFCQESMKETYLVLKDYVEQVQAIGVSADQIIVTATEASRVAKNSSEFYERVIGKLGIHVRVISGEGEAFYTALGVVRMQKSQGQVLLVDIGGASTEFIKIQARPFRIIESTSLPVGSVRASEWIEDNKFEIEIAKLVDANFIQTYQSEQAIFVAGTMTSLGAMYLGQSSYDGNELSKQSYSFEKISQFVKSLQSLSLTELDRCYPFLGKRSATIQAGAQVGYYFGQVLSLKSMEISPFGLRYGTLLEGHIEESYVSRHFR